MKKLYRLTPLALAIAATPALAQDSDTAALEQRIDALQQQVNSLSNDRVRFNGFLSTGYSRASNDAGFAGIDTSSEIYDVSLMALQGSFDITDEIQAVMQIVGRGEESWEPDMEWAYLSYRPMGALQLRAGKMRQPLFMYSDFLELGYSQPWARAPQSVYGQSPSSYMGADAAYTFNLDASAVTTQVFGGHLEDEDEGRGVIVDVRNSFGASTSWTNYVWTVRGVVSTGKLNLETSSGQQLVSDESASYLGFGVSYDDGSWQIISEATRTEIDGFYADTDAAYLSVGHRFGAFTPYVVIGRVESKDNDERPAMLAAMNTERDEYSVGVRWDVTPGVALKADWTHVTGFEDGPSGLDAQTVLAEGIDNTNVYTFKIDAAF